MPYAARTARQAQFLSFHVHFLVRFYYGRYAVRKVRGRARIGRPPKGFVSPSVVPRV